MKNTLTHIRRNPIIPVYYNDDVETCISVFRACYNGGIRVFEFTNRGVNSQKNFAALLQIRNAEFPDMLLGIGTIRNAEQAKTFIDLGADFIVSPIIKAEIAAVAATSGTFWIPGCMTPTEIDLAEGLGAQLVKLFPGDTLGAGFLKAIKPLFPNLSFMPTGGVDLGKENIENWLSAGVSALGFGSKLFQTPQPQDSDTDYQWLTERCSNLISNVR
ncbi:MAG: bifunctional 4-hydroxy-2-oxoglutarate aldolase/2-dehydro-3-deoxy-phosphogluconate aldolase [Pedobacter sp.]|nr:MAG: bifunctional 4-hydroxy-2-oxoglutarate aldolase/2-dehydro-3-deoxy-phosphogluconate aldolase [Pedobacter sp.]